MRRPIMIQIAVAALFFCGGVAVCGDHAKPTDNKPKRSFHFSYEVTVPANPEAGGGAHLWIPVPQSGPHQNISNLKIASEVKHKMGRDGLYGDVFALFSPTATQTSAGYRVVMAFDVTRREYGVDVNAPALQKASARIPANDKLLHRYLEPDKLVPLNATIAELAKEHTEETQTPLEKARSIYTYVASTMHYDKSGEGWGRGDAMWACDSKRGNCTDFHSVLIGMLRSSGIAARFEIGFPLPEGKSEGDIPGYHCWAEFYLNGVGWIPVDASEASKNPAKRGYFFGTVDVNRVMFTYGRDIHLSAEQKGEALNYFVYPYAEENGKPVKSLQTHFSFRDLTSQEMAGRSSASPGH